MKEIPYEDLAGQLDIFGHELTDDEIIARRKPTRTTKARLASLQHEMITKGYHPLGSFVHPLALVPALASDGARKPYSCGTCAYRNVVAGHANPKCDLLPPVVDDSSADDCLAWWPACLHYRERAPS